MAKQATLPLARVVPSPQSPGKLSVTDLENQYRNADLMIETAVRHEVPASLDTLAAIRRNLQDTIALTSLPATVRRMAVGTLLRCEAYKAFTESAIHNGSRRIVVDKESIGSTIAPAEVIATVRGGGPGATVRMTRTKAEASAMFSVRDRHRASFLALRFEATSPLEAAPQAIMLEGPGAVVLAEDLTVEGFAQDLRWIRWLNVRFNKCLITYQGGPLYLVDVKFSDCKFDFAQDAISQWVLSKIRASGRSPVTLSSEYRF